MFSHISYNNKKLTSKGDSKLNSDNFKVNLSLRDTLSKLDFGIVKESVTGEKIDYHL